MPPEAMVANPREARCDMRGWGTRSCAAVLPPKRSVRGPAAQPGAGGSTPHRCWNVPASRAGAGWSASCGGGGGGGGAAAEAADFNEAAAAINAELNRRENDLKNREEDFEKDAKLRSRDLDERNKLLDAEVAKRLDKMKRLEHEHASQLRAATQAHQRRGLRRTRSLPFEA